MNQEPDNYEIKKDNNQLVKIFWLIFGVIMWMIAFSDFLISHFSG